MSFMEYRLNKVDYDLQQLVNNTTKEGRVHGNKETNKVNKDKKERNKKQYSEDLKKELVKQKKKKIIVNAIKVQNIRVNAFRDKESKTLIQGRFLDTKL
ncbi:hypothetical protein G8S49_00615 [Clostridium botulinum C]|uniref:Uncharacterized protein n=3 Tax=Clostridium botulinum TaxID=1491 RepID=A0A9Q4TMT2_CLOBO|nr:hypothetical protein [Clostridium botulinum C]NFD86941.1 hypothetical protein [Clostridium botulinum]MCD3199296.1 hypothetical protein [Clostridium botulinum C]MCD3204771.1 hypothetical protein [Clostridium botulinum C]MCD3207596.1 hypothetical protein [Clostridium botulinum C]